MTATAPPAPSSEARTRGPQPYDFRRPRLLSQDRLRILHTIHEAFGRQLAVHLSAQLRTLVELSVASIEQRTYAAVVAASTAPTAFFSGDAVGTDHCLLLQIDARLALFVAEKLFGGTGAFVDEPRPLSQIEQRVAHRLAERTFTDLASSWRDTAALNLVKGGYEADVQFVQLLPDAAPVVLVHFDVCVRERCAPLTLCYPFALVQHLLGAAPAKAKVTRPAEAVPPPVRDQYTEAVGATTVELRAELGRTRLGLGDLLSLAVGDVIPLQRRPSEPLPVYVGAQPRFKAQAGRSGSRCALQIVEIAGPALSPELEPPHHDAT
jgi:flagellar motor switch protein FliM